ncbi:hypothetical protein [Streptomyces sp. NBC_00083]|uniref:SCO2400 family protein n=1 Tax=Streptomyces sp. NBC_00083 TaxID=2975647 RepID=UPI002256F9B2|nr:hypothetical protein [Streptomyces sp. NBC_00083]MCX5382651.1 hypothetical protein [Streptomyces sp. NBC_00083]
MDYCHACRRHLNGALACAGCGTPAQELAPAPEDELLVHAGAPPSRRGAEVLAPSGHRRARKGRRARRKRGKAVLFGSAGLVLVAGAVGFVQMAMEPPVNDRASSVQEDETISDPQPLPSGSAVTGPSRPTAEPVSSRRRGSGAGAGSPGGADGPRHAGPAPKETPSGSVDPRPSSARPSDSVAPGVSDPPGPGGPAPSASPSSAAPPPPPPPSPSPSPSATCHRFLWWCA